SRAAGFKIRSARRMPAERAHDAKLTDLIRVVPVAASLRSDGVRITLLSLERYDDGFVTQMRVQTEGRSGEFALVDILPVARDEAGTPYTTWPHGGSGGGARDGI